MSFSGSYDPADVTFLLKQVQVSSTDIWNKERHIQRGGHYSEVLTVEEAPPRPYEALFRDACDRNGVRLANDVLRLANEVARARATSQRIAVVSLARAGTPIGVLVHRALARLLGRESEHYCVSIIRDRGLDTNALHEVLQRHAPEDLVFIDGWTGKGVIGAELRKSVEAYNAEHHTLVDPSLYVVADLAGTAHFAATGADYLLPSAVLNSTVSGLVSRTVLTADIGPLDFHGCAYYGHLTEFDLSRWFVDFVFSEMTQARLEAVADVAPPAEERNSALNHAINRYMTMFDFADLNRIKPGVGEATRVMLRRAPRHLVLRTPENPDVRHLIHLAQTRRAAVSIDPSLPCEAIAIIDKAD